MELHCPDCGAQVPEFPRGCPACGLPLTGPVARELWLVDLEIGRLTGHRQTLIERLRAASDTVPPVMRPGVPAPPPAAEISRFGVRDVLLVLGGALLGIAAIVFTVISWGELGLGVRALILLSLTGVALGAAWPLARRMLHATAETVAAVGLVLIVLECHAARAIDLFDLAAVDGRWYAVGATIACTLLWAGYGQVAPVRLPRPTAIAMAQVPLPLAVYAAEASPAVMALALVVVSAADLAAWRIAAGAERTVATVAGIATGLAGTLVALGFSFSADPALAYAGVLVAAAAVALGWAAHLERFIAVAAGSAAAVALATPLPLPDRWSAAGYAVAALAVLAGAHLLAVRLRTSGALGASVVLGGAALWVAPGAAIAALSPARQLADVWSGVPAMLPAEDADRILPATPLVLALLAVVLVAADRTAHLLRALPGRLAPHTASPADAAQQAARSADVPPQAVPQQGVQQQGAPSAHATSPWAAASQAAAPRVFTPWAAVARGAAPVPAALAALTLPAVLAMPYEGALALLVAVAGALGAWAALDRTARVTAGGTAVVAALPAAVAALATRPATLAALGALTLLSIVHAVLAPALRAGATAVAVVALGGFAAALGLVAGLPVRWAAFGVLAGAALGAVAAARVRSVPAEVASWVVAAVAVAMTAGHPAQFSLALALTGVLALGVSLRADRRSAAWAGSALMLVAFWTRLGAVGVTVPEAYTAPVSVGALLVGALRRRRDRTLSSWVAYGSGLAVTLVPSLLAVWAETGRLRALLLALAAVVVTVAGARARLQAPLLLGGAVLLLDAAHELAPAVAEVTARLPGWCPIAVIGLAVLLLGATYEQRLRDLRRLREAVTRLG